jgi:hypothetical protein
MTMSVETIKTVTRRYKLKLSDTDIIDLLQGKQRCQNVPDNAVVTFHVPGGGDWSNTTMEVCSANPVTVEWTVTSEQDE